MKLYFAKLNLNNVAGFMYCYTQMLVYILSLLSWGCAQRGAVLLQAAAGQEGGSPRLPPAERRQRAGGGAGNKGGAAPGAASRAIVYKPAATFLPLPPAGTR